MIANLIRWSLHNRLLVLLLSLLLAGWGVFAVRNTPVDAIPDLSDVQVIIKTSVSRAGAAGRGGPGYLSADDRHAVGAWGVYGAWVFVLW